MLLQYARLNIVMIKFLYLTFVGDGPENYKALDFNSSHVNKGSHIAKNGSLVLYNVHKRDHGYYLCHSSNGVSTGLSKVVFLTVRGKLLCFSLWNDKSLPDSPW